MLLYMDSIGENVSLNFNQNKGDLRSNWLLQFQETSIEYLTSKCTVPKHNDLIRLFNHSSSVAGESPPLLSTIHPTINMEEVGFMTCTAASH